MMKTEKPCFDGFHFLWDPWGESQGEILDENDRRWSKVWLMKIDFVFDADSEYITRPIGILGYPWKMGSQVSEKDLFSTILRTVCSEEEPYLWIILYVVASLCRAVTGLSNGMWSNLDGCIRSTVGAVQYDWCTHFRCITDLLHQEKDRKRSIVWHLHTSFYRGEEELQTEMQLQSKYTDDRDKSSRKLNGNQSTDSRPGTNFIA